MRWTWANLACLLAVTVTPAARAQNPSEDGFDKDAEDTLAGKQQLDEEKAAGNRMPGEKEPPKPAETGPDPEFDPREEEGKAYRFIGLRFRNVIVPKFILNLFADGGQTTNVFTFGPELSSRKDHLELNFALSYADYSMDPFLFKGKDDGIEAYERVSSTMKLLYLTLDVLYEIPIDEDGRFALLVGGGIGLAPVFGNIYRNQVYPDDPNNPDVEDPTRWKDCQESMRRGPGANGNGGQPVPGTNKFYCDTENDHYVKDGTTHTNDPDTTYSEPSWANGGSKPFIFPWISLPQISMRFKPIKQINTRVDFGFSITGFFFGMNAGYALPL